MFLKVCLLSAAVPSTLAGGYFLTKTFDAQKILGSSEVYVVVKAMKPHTQVHGFIAQSKDKMYDDNNKKFRCSITKSSHNVVYDNGCEIYQLEDTPSNTTTTPVIIDIETIKKKSKNKSTQITHADIKENKFYILKIDPYIFQDVDNSTKIQLVNMDEFPTKKEFANLRVESVLDGGWYKSQVNDSEQVPLSFKDKFKSNLLLVKLTKKDTNFSWNNNLKCSVAGIITSCNALKVDSVTANKKFSNLTLTSLTQVTESNHTTNLTQNNYFILDVHSRSRSLKINDSIAFVDNNSPINNKNTFQVIAGIFGTLTSSNTFSDQVMFVSVDDKVGS